jgi:ABC-type transport system substrate-binding protein
MRQVQIFQLCLAATIFAGVLVFQGCGNQEEKESATAEKEELSTASIHRGGTYRFPLMNSPSTLDPAYVRDKYGETLVHQLYEGLVRFDPYLAVTPALAETWKVEDNGKTYRFIIRENARFHDGQPVTAEDVVFSISRLLRLDPPPATLPHLLKINGAQEFRNHKAEQITGLDAIEDRVLLVRLEEPHAPFLTALGMYQASIVSKKGVTRLGDRFGQSPIGNGPFRFVSWNVNQSIQLKRFQQYYAGESLLDEVHYIIYPGGEKATVLNDFKKGDLEEMPVYGKIRQDLAAEKGLQWFHRPSLSLLFYGIRGNHPLLSNPEVRKALSMAIDRKRLVQEVYNGRFEPARTILPPGMPGYRENQAAVVEDIAKARELIKGAIGNNIQPIEIVSASQSAFAKAELNLILEFWGKLGIPLKIKYITDWKAFSAYRKSESVQIYRAAWFADMPDPDSFLHPLFASDSPVNYMRYQNEEVDRLLQTARGIIDPIKRAEMYQQIEQIILESSPVIPLFYLSVDRVYQSSVQDIRVSALGAHTMPLYRIWLKDGSTQP